MYTCYYDSAEGITISRARAFREIQRHGIVIYTDTIRDFFACCGDREYYDAQTVLTWLGY